MMARRITQSGKFIVTMSVVATMTIGGTAIAASSFDAENANKVDGKHAISATPKPGARTGKLVATNSSGYLPNNIIVKSLGSDRVDGKHAVNATPKPGARKGKLVATNSSGYLPNNIIVKSLGSDRVDGKHAANATASVDDRKLKLVATNSAGYLPNNIIVKAPNSDELDGLDSTAFAKLSGFYRLYGTATGEVPAPSDYAGDWVGVMLCGEGDIAVSADWLEKDTQTVRGMELYDDYAVALWDDSAVSSDLDMSIQCLDTNGDLGGAATAGADAHGGLAELIEP